MSAEHDISKLVREALAAPKGREALAAPKSVVTDEADRDEVAELDELDDITLARFLDGTLPPHERRRVEAQLASSASARQWLWAARPEPEDEERAPGWLTPGWLTPGWLTTGWRLPALASIVLGLVAGLSVLVIGHLGVLPSASPSVELTTTALDESVFVGLDPELAEQTRQALGGVWPQPRGFESFLGDERAVVRGRDTATPQPLAPRWQTIRETRPTFRWHVETDGVEILLLDDQEQVVFTVEASGQELTYPVDAPALEAGRLYAWRVGSRVDGDWLTSNFVPFRLLDTEEERVLEDALTRAGTHPLPRAVVLVSHGLIDEARALLSDLSPSPEKDRLLETLRGLP
ncbi:MAG: hypothetical protein AAGD38_20045 [Acidobacteriota bacterium]